jgi:hypothetical protein
MVPPERDITIMGLFFAFPAEQGRFSAHDPADFTAWLSKHKHQILLRLPCRIQAPLLSLKPTSGLASTSC